MRDEDQIHVPRIGEAPPLLDLNVATAEDLEDLPGIGPVYASRIIEARVALLFTSSDDLLDRELIPARIYEQIRVECQALVRRRCEPERLVLGCR